MAVSLWFVFEATQKGVPYKRHILGGCRFSKGIGAQEANGSQPQSMVPALRWMFPINTEQHGASPKGPFPYACSFFPLRMCFVPLMEDFQKGSFAKKEKEKQLRTI